eukprot:3881675-Rhodomonas_salina.3
MQRGFADDPDAEYEREERRILALLEPQACSSPVASAQGGWSSWAEYPQPGEDDSRDGSGW